MLLEILGVLQEANDALCLREEVLVHFKAPLRIGAGHHKVALCGGTRKKLEGNWLINNPLLSTEKDKRGKEEEGTEDVDDALVHGVVQAQEILQQKSKAEELGRLFLDVSSKLWVLIKGGCEFC